MPHTSRFTTTSSKHAFSCSNGTASPFSDEINAEAAFMDRQDISWMQKPSSPTITSISETPLPTSAPSAFSFFHWIFVRITYALLTTEAVLFLRLTGFLRTHGPVSNTFPLAIKDNQTDFLSEAELLAFRQCNRRQRRSQHWASFHDSPMSIDIDEAAHVTRSSPASPLQTGAYVDRATEVTASLPLSPTSSPSIESPPKQSSFRPEATAFVVNVPQAKAPMTREQFDQFVMQYPMHGRRAA
ncbi:MAG: hypothetical protein Q9216_005028 [Gyalolechia sp. 2 TL-2023]